MRCPDCGKFVSYDEQDPEVNDLQINDEGQITAEVRIVNACAECGTELKSYDFSTEMDVGDECEGHTAGTRKEEPEEGEEAEEVEEHELSIEEGCAERITRTEGKGRYTKTFYGFRLEAVVTCSCGKLGVTKGTVTKVNEQGVPESTPDFSEGINVEVTEDVQASDMNEEV